MPNRCQVSKAQLIAATLILAAAQSTKVPMDELAFIASIMSEAEWISVSLQAGVAVADTPCRVLVVALLGRLA